MEEQSSPAAYVLPRKPRRGERFDVRIDRLDLDGHGEADLPVLLGPQRTERSFTVHARDAVPGDRVEIEVERVRRGAIVARVARRVAPAPDRIEPRCPHFGAREEPGRGCGGCRLQSLTYAAQLEHKRALVQRALADPAIDVPPVLGQREPWGYRNKMEFSFGKTRDGALALGLHPLGYRWELINLQACHLLSDFAAPFLAAVRAWVERRGVAPYRHREDAGFLRTLTVREGKRTGERMVVLTTSAVESVPTVDGPRAPAAVAEDFGRCVEQIAQMLGPVTSLFWTEQRTRRGEPTRWIDHHLGGSAVLREELRLPDAASLSFEIHPRAFFQPNTLQAEVLYAQVVKAAGLGGVGLDGVDRAPRRVLDLYCGTGTIAACLGRYAEQVIGVELSVEAVDNARRNAALNGLSNVRFIDGDVGDVLERERAGDLQQADLVVVDPPRSGLLPGALAQLARLRAPRLVYVSCNPQALGRDLVALQRAGYRLLGVQPVDMFPQTAHIETVATLVTGT